MKILVLWLLPLLAQIPFPVPHVPSVPGLPSQLPIPPLVPASTSAIVVQPSQRLLQVEALDDFSPARYASLADLSRDGDGVYTLPSGAFEMIDESFCLRIAGHAPGEGDSYFIGTLSGDRASYVRNVMVRWHSHPEIDQRSVQLLLWAITSRSVIGELVGPAAHAAHVLLTPQEIYQLDGGALGMLRSLNQAGVPLPVPVQQALVAESQVRDLLTHGNGTYQEIAAIAAPRAPPEPPSGVRDRWSFSPQGYFIRYLPLGFPTTVVQIDVPPRYTITRDSRGNVSSIADDVGTSLRVSGTQATLFITPLISPGRLPRVQRVRLGTLLPEQGVSTAELERFAQEVRAPASFVSDAATVDATARAAEQLVQRSPASFDKDRALDFLRQALPFVLCSAAGACSGDPQYDPTNNLGAPNNSGQQPLGQSGNPEPQDKNRDCDGMREQLQGAREARAAYNNPQVVAQAQAHHWTDLQYLDAVDHVLNPGGSSSIMGSGLAGSSGSSSSGEGFQTGGYTDSECNAHVPSLETVVANGLPAPFWQIMVDHEAVHQARCASNPTAYNSNSWQELRNGETAAYNKEISEIEQWLRQNCP